MGKSGKERVVCGIAMHSAPCCKWGMVRASVASDNRAAWLIDWRLASAKLLLFFIASESLLMECFQQQYTVSLSLLLVNEYNTDVQNVSECKMEMLHRKRGRNYYSMYIAQPLCMLTWASLHPQVASSEQCTFSFPGCLDVYL